MSWPKLKGRMLGLDVLVLIHNQSQTGAYHKVVEMCQALGRLGHRVTLLCTSGAARGRCVSRRDGEVEVVEAPDLLWGRLRQGVDLWNCLRRIWFLAPKRFDVVYAIDSRPVVVLPALWVKAQRSVPLVMSWWDWFGRRGTALERSGALYDYTVGVVETWFEESFRRYADRATATSSVLLGRLAGLGYPKDKMRLLRVGCNALEMPQFQRAAVRQQLGLPASETILCYVGALLPRDAELLLGSLRVLKDRVRRMPQTVLVGNHRVEHDVRRELSISVTGYLREFREVAAYLGAADYGLVPMRLSVANMARWPSKTGDYWAAGLPVIATPVSDYAELFPRHDLGFLAAGDSPEDLACAMEAALAAQAKERDRMSLAAKIFAKHELEWSVVAQRLEDVFRSAMEGNDPQAVRA